MQVHGRSRKRGGERKTLGGERREGQHCIAVLHSLKLWSIAIRTAGCLISAGAKEDSDERPKQDVSDRGHSRRWHRKGSDAGGSARDRSGGEEARRWRAFRPF